MKRAGLRATLTDARAVHLANQLAEEHAELVRAALLAPLLTLGVMFSPGAAATVDLTAVKTRIGEHPAYVRVVVDFTDGVVADNELEAIDARAADGSVVVRLQHRRVQAQAAPARDAGVRVTVAGGRDRLDVQATYARQRFKYVQVSTLHAPERLVIDLYRSRPPTRAAEIRTGRRGCLSLASVSPGRRSFRVTGRERDLFEHSFVLRVRDRTGRVVGRRIMTAVGPWSAATAYRVGTRQPGTVEAVADSARDGSLACLVQVRVTLTP